jgi:hypothetical protein
MAIFDTGYKINAVGEEDLYKTTSFGGSDALLDNTDPVGATDGYTSDIIITDELAAALSFEYLGNNSTDDLVLTIFKRVKSAWTGNELVIASITIPNDGTQDVYTGLELGEHRAYGHGVYRIAMQSSGATTTFNMEAIMTRSKKKSVEQ